MRSILFGFIGLLIVNPVLAGVTMQGTRVIFDSSQLSQSVIVVNTNEYDVVVQSWVDDGNLNNKPNTAIAPVITNPALFTLKQGAAQVIQLVNISNKKHEDEKLYWLNLYEIPPKNSVTKDKIILTMQKQYKLFYRSPSMNISNSEIVKSISFSVVLEDNTKEQKYLLEVKNQAPLHVNLAGLFIDGQPVYDFPNVLKPNSVNTIPLLNKPKDKVINFNIINDSGFISNASKNLTL